ncbi:RidA family protein [Tindallia californiensis]|uniref:2-iminobutanoate/2-iminopropanoate deaminase n=1 Tax=Tindallia californiensis TaxID=159292 RepID=A0A1H3LIK5_9FIRM|nr:Rid family detoxifying hydrolase [Tindallia californiensis]SDY64377.1 2-iminobutanoate/2-iminopropanoate deaminase [Tindallia californiensis]
MTKRAVHPAEAPLPAGPYNHAIIAGGFVFVSGQTPEKPGTDVIEAVGIKEHTRQVMENIKAILEAAGCGLEDLVKVEAHLKDMKDFDGFNEVYGQYVSQPYPARITVQSVLPPGDPLVEISVIAKVKE